MTDREIFAWEVFPKEYIRNNALSSATTRIWHVHASKSSSFKVFIHWITEQSLTYDYIEISFNRERISSLEKKSRRTWFQLLRWGYWLYPMPLVTPKSVKRQHQIERYRVDIRIRKVNQSLSKWIVLEFNDLGRRRSSHVYHVEISSSRRSMLSVSPLQLT